MNMITINNKLLISNITTTNTNNINKYLQMIIKQIYE